MSTNTLPPVREMQRAYRERDSSYDGVFFLAVRTTGIFCRPSCPARKPRPENVTFFESVRTALFAGFRPCKRCRPLEADGRPPEWAARLLAAVEAEPSRRIRDADIRDLGIDPARARRHFLKHYGMTFQAYSRSRRMGTALAEIRLGQDLDEVVLGHGYESHSGFRDAFVRTFGKPPGRSRTTDCVLLTWLETPLGPLVAGATSAGVCLLEFTDRRMFEKQIDILNRRLGYSMVPGENEHLTLLRRELTGYFDGKRRAFDVPLVYPGSPFQVRVWEELMRIPYGETRTYENLAASLGSPRAHRAVGRANGFNRIAILIPCHRVVTKSGALGGYGGGVWRKQALLELERGSPGAAVPPETRSVPR
jgi:AraC family transcriptional regulator, regulatory protein of adaptative response / methylated-DNA-[protein]-cysteine methyltransferase